MTHNFVVDWQLPNDSVPVVVDGRGMQSQIHSDTDANTLHQTISDGRENPIFRYVDAMRKDRRHYAVKDDCPPRQIADSVAMTGLSDDPWPAAATLMERVGPRATALPLSDDVTTRFLCRTARHLPHAITEALEARGVEVGSVRRVTVVSVGRENGMEGKMFQVSVVREVGPTITLGVKLHHQPLINTDLATENKRRQLINHGAGRGRIYAATSEYVAHGWNYGAQLNTTFDVLQRADLSDEQRMGVMLMVHHHIAAALARLHAVLVAHGDFKGENAIVCADGGGRLIDFGLAATPDTPSPGMGSPHLASPARIVNIHTRAWDIYAQGSSLLRRFSPEQQHLNLCLFPEYARNVVGLIEEMGQMYYALLRNRDKDPGDVVPGIESARRRAIQKVTLGEDEHGSAWLRALLLDMTNLDDTRRIGSASVRDQLRSLAEMVSPDPELVIRQQTAAAVLETMLLKSREGEEEDDGADLPISVFPGRRGEVQLMPDGVFHTRRYGELDTAPILSGGVRDRRRAFERNFSMAAAGMGVRAEHIDFTQRVVRTHAELYPPTSGISLARLRSLVPRWLRR